MPDTKKLIPVDQTPLNNHHADNIDELSGNEFIAGGTPFIDSLNFWFTNAKEKTPKFLYNQNEFAEEFSKNYCTAYGPLGALSCTIERQITSQERHQICVLRTADPDFDPNNGGMTAVGVNTLRNWWNKANPNNKVRSFAVDNDSEFRRELFRRGYPTVISIRIKKSFVDDYRGDGVLNNVNYTDKTLGGHCLWMHKLVCKDNYDREYKYQSIEDYYTAKSQGVNTATSFVFFMEKDLSPLALKWVKLMEMKITNGERANENMTRQEVAITVLRLNPEAKLFWNELDGPKDVTRSEFHKMLEVGTGKKFPIQIFSESTKNKPIQRGECWTLIASLLGL